MSLGRLCWNSLIASATTTSRNLTPAPRGCKIACERVLFFRLQLGGLPQLPGVPHLHVNRPLKVHLITNTSSNFKSTNFNYETTINLGTESLGAISSWRPKSSIDRLSFLELRDTVSTRCANEKLMWNQADCFCKERNLSSIPRWLQYVLSRQQFSTAPTKAVR